MTIMKKTFSKRVDCITETVERSFCVKKLYFAWEDAALSVAEIRWTHPIGAVKYCNIQGGVDAMVILKSKIRVASGSGSHLPYYKTAVHSLQSFGQMNLYSL